MPGLSVVVMMMVVIGWCRLEWALAPIGCVLLQLPTAPDAALLSRSDRTYADRWGRIFSRWATYFFVEALWVSVRRSSAAPQVVYWLEASWLGHFMTMTDERLLQQLAKHFLTQFSFISLKMAVSFSWLILKSRNIDDESSNSRSDVVIMLLLFLGCCWVEQRIKRLISLWLYDFN